MKRKQIQEAGHNQVGRSDLICQCGGKLETVTERHGSLWDERDAYRVRCTWCPASSRWLSSEYDAIVEFTEGQGIRHSPKR